MTAYTAALTDTTGITETIAGHSVRLRALSDTVGITDKLIVIHLTDTTGITATLSINASAYVQFDSWRPVARPDNKIILLCRTPEGEHDSYLGLQNLTLWTILPDTTTENPVVLQPSTHGWVSYGHPEWSPDGNEIVVWTETSSAYQLRLLDASGFSR